MKPVQCTAIGVNGVSVNFGDASIVSVSPGAFKKIVPGTSFTLAAKDDWIEEKVGAREQDQRLAAAVAEKNRLAAEKDQLAKEKDRLTAEKDRLRGNFLTGLSQQQLNELAGQMSDALARVHSQQESLRAQLTDCVVCCAEPRAILFQCNHHCCCATCADSLDKCPMCQATITERRRVFSADNGMWARACDL